MKKFISILALLFTMTVTVNAMSYEQARQQALFLTDKMAYELNLTNDQYEAAYEINLDYLIGVNTYDDLYGPYWRYRNVDLSYVLLDWQYRAYCAASYFYRPLYFSDGLSSSLRLRAMRYEAHEKTPDMKNNTPMDIVIHVTVCSRYLTSSAPTTMAQTARRSELCNTFIG